MDCTCNAFQHLHGTPKPFTMASHSHTHTAMGSLLILKFITQSAYYRLKNMARIEGFLSKQDKEKLDHAFIFCRLDYCNGIFTSLKQTNKQTKDSNQAAAADPEHCCRPDSSQTRGNRTTQQPSLSQRWLPVSQRTDFKISLLVCKATEWSWTKNICMTYKFLVKHPKAPEVIWNRFVSCPERKRAR